LGQLWTTVLETPAPNNPFGSGNNVCWRLPNGQVAPFSAQGGGTCTVGRSTDIFVAAPTNECSTFTGDTCDGTTYSQLLAHAEALDAMCTTHAVTVDNDPVSLRAVVTPLLNIVLTGDNIFGAPGGTSGLSAAHGWVILLSGLSVGSHTIHIDIGGAGCDVAGTSDTTINVLPTSTPE
jgi:hypothetical protein